MIYRRIYYTTEKNDDHETNNILCYKHCVLQKKTLF